jgi:hypothetical protein
MLYPSITPLAHLNLVRQSFSLTDLDPKNKTAWKAIGCSYLYLRDLEPDETLARDDRTAASPEQVHDQ